jgi:hypothetical protein
LRAVTAVAVTAQGFRYDATGMTFVASGPF